MSPSNASQWHGLSMAFGELDRVRGLSKSVTVIPGTIRFSNGESSKLRRIEIAMQIANPIWAFVLMLMSASSPKQSWEGSAAWMSPQECDNAEYCRFRGVISVHRTSKDYSATISMEQGKCYNISLPRRRMNAVRRRGGSSEVEVYGEKLKFPILFDFDRLKIKGRYVSRGPCSGDFYLFVDNNNIVFL